jgi:A nuclease of the HNH/ENDO VII superfamily with conserved WHH
MEKILDEVWARVVGGMDWLKQVIFGEFDDSRDMSAVIADMLVSFVPGVIIVTSARDLVAVVMRMVKHPDKREEPEEWMLIVACAIPLVLPVLAAAAGAAAAGVGAIVGGIAGSEAGAVLRAVCLLLIKKGAYVLVEVVGFLRKFVKGNIIVVLRDVKFVKYGPAMVDYLIKFITKIRNVIAKLANELKKLPLVQHWVEPTLQRLVKLERGFYGVQTSAMSAIPKALIELDARLAAVLEQALGADKRLAHAGIPAPPAAPIKPEKVKVPSQSANPLGVPPSTTRVKPASPVVEKPNLHPEKPKKPRKPRQPTKSNKNVDHSRTAKNADGSTTYYDKQGRAVTYNKDGYPDFSPHSEADVKVNGLKGKIPPDDKIANKAAGLSSTPANHTWHHVEDGKTMQLIPSDIHSTFPHTGGASLIKNGN